MADHGQARPGLAPERDINGELVFISDELQYADTTPNLRWVGNGRVVLDNKGNVLEAYEPYYSSTPDFEDEAELVEQGVSPLNHYDPLGRLIRTDLPNGTFSKVEFTAWEQTTWDPNDTVLESDWYVAKSPPESHGRVTDAARGPRPEGRELDLPVATDKHRPRGRVRVEPLRRALQRSDPGPFVQARDPRRQLAPRAPTASTPPTSSRVRSTSTPPRPRSSSCSPASARPPRP